jgi:hypothetical protein
LDKSILKIKPLIYNNVIYKYGYNRYKNIIAILYNMSVNTPPTEDIPIFDASVFPQSSGTALTIASGQKYFLSYPVAQGTEIFPSNVTFQSTITDSSGDVGTVGQVLSSTGTGTTWTNAGGISGNLDLPPPYGLLTDTITQSASHVSGTDINLYGTSTDSDILIGSTLPNLKTLRICNTTSGASGASVHCSNIGFDGGNINNATNPATGTVKLGNTLTTGPLFIGCGATTAIHTSGPIIIGSDSTSTGGINIGTGTDLTVPTTNTINIGKSGVTTTFPNGLSLSSGKYITTSHTGTVTAPTSTQVGGIVTGSNISTTVPTSDNISSISSIALSPGTWSVYAVRAYNNSNNSTRIIFSFGTTLRTNVSSNATDYEHGLTTVFLSSALNYMTLSGTISVTTALTLYLNFQPTYTTAPAIPTTNLQFKAVRIA